MSTKFSLAKKIEELEAIEAYFQRPDMDLDEAMEKHKQALTLSKEILAYLAEAESTLRQIQAGELGAASDADGINLEVED